MFLFPFITNPFFVHMDLDPVTPFFVPPPFFFSIFLICSHLKYNKRKNFFLQFEIVTGRWSNILLKVLKGQFFSDLLWFVLFLSFSFFFFLFLSFFPFFLLFEEFFLQRDKTIFHYVCEQGSLEMAEYLLDKEKTLIDIADKVQNYFFFFSLCFLISTKGGLFGVSLCMQKGSL